MNKSTLLLPLFLSCTLASAQTQELKDYRSFLSAARRITAELSLACSRKACALARSSRPLVPMRSIWPSCTLASAQTQELKDYRSAQVMTFGCSTDFTVAIIDGSRFTQGYACVKTRRDNVQAMFKPILDAAPSQAHKDALINIQVAYVTAAGAIAPDRFNPRLSEARLATLRDKLDEAWARYLVQFP